MNNFFVGSDCQFPGKTTIAICAAMALQKKKQKVGYFKPCGTNPVQGESGFADYDALSAAKHLKLTDSPADISPVLLTRDLKMKILKGNAPDVKAAVAKAYKKIAAGKDAVIIEGGRTMEEGRFAGYPTEELLKDYKCRLIYVEKYEESRGLDTALAWRARLGKSFQGLIFNRVDPDHEEFLEKYVMPYLEKAGVPVLGMLADDPVISAVTVSELAEALGGKIIAAARNSENLIQHFIIGAMSLESASARFRKLHNKAVVTGGDRMDLQVAALGTSTRCLVLTGGMTPHPLILSKAEETGIPVVVLPQDTLAAMERIDELVKRPHLKQSEKIARAMKMFTKGVNMKKLGL